MKKVTLFGADGRLYEYVNTTDTRVEGTVLTFHYEGKKMTTTMPFLMEEIVTH